MKLATVSVLLLATVVVAAAVDHQPATADVGGTTTGTLRRHGGHHRRGRDDNDDQSALTKLTQCATMCGADVTACMVKCFQPLSTGKGSPVALPLCLLACSTEVMSCASDCPAGIVN